MLLTAASLLAFGAVVRPAVAAPTTVYITVYAKQWSYDPSVIQVNQGDQVVITLVSLDVSHGMYIEGYNVGAKLILASREPNSTTFSFVADKAGVFIFLCDVPCGPGHPFMTGVLKVDPDNDYSVAGLSAVIVALLGSAYFVTAVNRPSGG